MASDLGFLQSLTERELTELVVIPLLEELEYQDIRYTHGILEHGKDVVCLRRDPLEGDSYFGFVIKARALSGSVSSNRSLREVLYQAEQALRQPFLSPLNGSEVALKHVYILTSHLIDPIAVASIQGQLRDKSAQLSFIDGPKLLSLVQQHLPGLLSSIPDPTHVYLLGIRQRFLQLSTAISLGSQRELRLTDIYTGGGLTPTTPAEAAYLSFADLQIETAGLTAQAVYDSCRYLVLLADVGAGKTTLLKKLALDLVSEGTEEDIEEPEIIPIFIELSALPKNAARSQHLFQSWLSETINQRIRGQRFKFGESNRFLLLLDGFDELPLGHEAVEEYLLQVWQHFPAGLILTSRPSRIPRLSEPFSYFRLDPFRNDEIGLFLYRWFHDEERVKGIMDHIAGDQTLLGFCRTPLLLTLYAVLAASDSLDQLPSRRAEIYESLATLLLGRWDSMRKVTNQFSPGLKSYVLEQMAFSLHERGRKVFGKEDVIGTAVPLLAEPTERSQGAVPRTVPTEKATLLFDELIFRSSLIRRHEEGHFYFSHLSFQEFFASRHLMRRGDRKMVERLLFAEWWKNVISFYFGITRSMDGVRISSKKAAEKGHILIEYLAEADYTSQEQRENIYKLVASQLMSTNQLQASVVDACRRLDKELLIAMEELLKGSRDRIWIGFFDLCLQMGREGLGTALRQASRLEEYPPTVISRVVFRSTAHIGSKLGQRMFDNALFTLGNIGSSTLRRLSRAQRDEQLYTLTQDLRETIKRLSLATSIESNRRSRIIDTVKEVQNRLEQTAAAS